MELRPYFSLYSVAFTSELNGPNLECFQTIQLILLVQVGQVQNQTLANSLARDQQKIILCIYSFED